MKQHDELLSHLSKNIVIKGFIYMAAEKAPEEDAAKQGELHKLLKVVENEHLLKKVPFSKDPKDIEKNVLTALQKDGMTVPPVIPIVCILGGPGAGKGTACAQLVLDYGFRHISTGDVLRNYKEGKYYDLIHNLMIEGKLVPSDMLLEIVKEEIDRYNYEGVYLLDGFPRNEENMKVWEKVMAGFAKIEIYIDMECDEGTMAKRLLGRGGEGSQRADDKPEIIKKRFDTYHKMTVPFIKEILKKESDKVITVDATKSMKEVYHDLQEELAKWDIKPIQKNKEKPSVLFILGGPGAGKGTQCEILTKEYGYKHLSTGDLLREEIKTKGPESAKIEEFIKEGKLVPSSVLVQLMKNKMEKDGWSGHYLIDGNQESQCRFPQRHREHQGLALHPRRLSPRRVPLLLRLLDGDHGEEAAQEGRDQR